MFQFRPVKFDLEPRAFFGISASLDGGSELTASLRESTWLWLRFIANDRLGKKVRIKCDSEDTVGDLKVCIFLEQLTDCRNSSLLRRVPTGVKSSLRNGIRRIKITSSFPTMRSTTAWVWNCITSVPLTPGSMNTANVCRAEREVPV